MEQDFAIEKARFIENYNLARPIMTIWGMPCGRRSCWCSLKPGGWVEFVLAKFKREVMFPGRWYPTI